MNLEGFQMRVNADRVGKNAVWRHTLELNAEYQMPQQEMGRENENSGGHVVFLSPGTRLNLDDKNSLYISVGIPLLQSLHGYNLRHHGD